MWHIWSMHTSLGLLLGRVLKMSLYSSLSLSLSIFLVMSCLLITLIKCLKGHRSLGSLFEWQLVKSLVTESVSEWQGHLLSCCGQLNIGHAIGYIFLLCGITGPINFTIHFYILFIRKSALWIRSSLLYHFYHSHSLPIITIPLFSGSVYSVVAVALERYFNICKPFNRNLVSVVTEPKNRQRDKYRKYTQCMYILSLRYQ